MSVPDFRSESLSNDPIHGYIAFTTPGRGEVGEQTIVDHPWIQRLRHIHQLQSAWWVYPSAEHSRFPHSMGVMHLAGQAVGRLYSSLAEACANVPSREYVVLLARMAGLLHDVGHGPMGHFFDEQYLDAFGLNHELLSQAIITRELGAALRKIRRSPAGALRPRERLDPEEIAYLIRRPRSAEPGGMPRWLGMLRALWSGAYTVDNMDFVMRDSYMTGYRLQAFDLDRILHYSYFSEKGLTMHRKGLAALVSFLKTRSELFSVVYFHRTVRALDLAMEEVFTETIKEMFPGHPLRRLKAYQRLTDWALLETVSAWAREGTGKRKRLGKRWQEILLRRRGWKLAFETTVRFDEGQPHLVTIFSDRRSVADRIRAMLPARRRRLEFRVDVARHHPRPMHPAWDDTSQNFVYDPGRARLEPLAAQPEIRRLPTGEFLCRLYSRDHRYDRALADAFSRLLTPGGGDATNV